MRKTFVLAALFSCAAIAAEDVAPIDISKCNEFNCTTVWKGTYRIENAIEVKAWFDVVELSQSGKLSFFPLFSIKNENSSPVKLKLGMQLLDQNKMVLAQASDEVLFAPYYIGMSDQDRFLSINGVDLSAEIKASAKYVKVTYEKSN